MEIICPKCGKPAHRTKTKYGIRNYHCSLWSWGCAPLADKRTHKIRKEAHRSFDIIWESKFLTRSQAYRWLSKSLNIPVSECHMRFFDYEKCEKVIHLCNGFKSVLKLK